MIAYIGRRLLQSLFTVLGVILVTFVLFRGIGGNPAYQMAGKHATQDEIERITRELGYDKPLVLGVDSQLLMVYRQLLSFRFGRSYSTKQRISKMILDGIVPSLSIALPAFFLTLLSAVALSLVSAYSVNTLLDRTLVVVSVMGMCVPLLAYILGGQYYLAYKLGWFEIAGYAPGPAAWRYVMLPVLLSIIAGLGSGVRFYRTVMLDETRGDYVRTAMAKGVGKSRLLFVHVLKNAMIPILTRVVLSIPFLFLGSLLLENFFGIPGLGYITISAYFNADQPVLMAMTFIISLLYIAANLATDISYALVDPRVRFS